MLDFDFVDYTTITRDSDVVTIESRDRASFGECEWRCAALPQLRTVDGRIPKGMSELRHSAQLFAGMVYGGIKKGIMKKMHGNYEKKETHGRASLQI